MKIYNYFLVTCLFFPAVVQADFYLEDVTAELMTLSKDLRPVTALQYEHAKAEADKVKANPRYVMNQRNERARIALIDVVRRGIVLKRRVISESDKENESCRNSIRRYHDVTFTRLLEAYDKYVAESETLFTSFDSLVMMDSQDTFNFVSGVVVECGELRS